MSLDYTNSLMICTACPDGGGILDYTGVCMTCNAVFSNTTGTVKSNKSKQSNQKQDNHEQQKNHRQDNQDVHEPQSDHKNDVQDDPEQLHRLWDRRYYGGRVLNNRLREGNEEDVCFVDLVDPRGLEAALMSSFKFADAAV
jgi:hypothetical protein